MFPEFSGRLRIYRLTAANSFFNRRSSLDLRRGTQEEKGKACKAFYGGSIPSRASIPSNRSARTETPAGVCPFTDGQRDK